VTLPSPELGDTESPTYGYVFGANRNNELLNVSDADHPTTRMRVWRIRKMTKTLRDELQNFIQVTAGDRIKVTDYNSDAFNALVTNEDLEYIVIRDDCNYEVTLQLMEVS
jgi:hypothetical protein